MSRKPVHVNCLDLKVLKLSRPACLAIVASACEVYPKECMGNLCCLRPPKYKGRIVGAFPYQLARRNLDWATSESYLLFKKMLGGLGPWYIIGSYHSHPCYSKKYKFYCEPSEVDLKNMEVGDLEIIVRAMRQRKRVINSWRTTKAGSVSVAWGKFQFLLRAFVRLDDFDKSGVPLYKNVSLELE